MHDLSACYDVVSKNPAPNYQVSRTTLSYQKWKLFSLTWPDFKTWMKFDQSDLFILWISTMIRLAGPLIWAISGVGSDEKHDKADSKIIDRNRHLFLTYLPHLISRDFATIGTCGTLPTAGIGLNKNALPIPKWFPIRGCSLGCCKKILFFLFWP